MPTVPRRLPTPDDVPLLRIDDLSIERVAEPGRRLVDRLALEVRPGELVGLVGETGAGKSISMMAATGLLARGLRAIEGQVAFRGAAVPATAPARLRRNLGHGIALLFQNARGSLNPFMRVREQVERVLKLGGVPRGARGARAADHLRSVGLAPEEIGPRYPHQLSGGQAQRVALACALATEPALLIADEPTTALDVTTEREVLTLVQRLCRERTMGLILITHNLALVSQTCDRVVLLHAGHLVEQGSVAATFDGPLHPYTRGLLGAIPDLDAPRDLIPVPGSVWGGPRTTARCRFSHRCARAWGRCEEQVPPLYALGDREVRCFLYDPAEAASASAGRAPVPAVVPAGEGA